MVKAVGYVRVWYGWVWIVMWAGGGRPRKTRVAGELVLAIARMPSQLNNKGISDFAVFFVVQAISPAMV